MKRPNSVDIEASGEGKLKSKRVRFEAREESESGFSKLNENLLYEVLKHADARTLAMAACVSKGWHRTALDERLWELIYTRQCANINCGPTQLRSVVLALGGFRRLHALYFSKPFSSSSVPPPLSVAPQANKGSKRWGKDEVHLSLSLLSIRYYEKMNFANRSSK